MDDFFAALNETQVPLFSTIAEYAFGLGYRARRDKTKDLNYSFLHRGVKPLILRFSILKGQPVVRLKFFAATQYSRFFEDALKATIEEYDFRYTGCYGCEKCDGSQGYTIRYPGWAGIFPLRPGVDRIAWAGGDRAAGAAGGPARADQPARGSRHPGHGRLSRGVRPAAGIARLSPAGERPEPGCTAPPTGLQCGRE